MTPEREMVVAAFTSLKTLFCELGFFVESGIYVRYWGNRYLRQLTTYRKGNRDGYDVRRNGPTSPPRFRHLRDGKPFGEAKSFFGAGQGIEHVLFDGDTKIPFTEHDSVRFAGYLTTHEEESLYAKYAICPHKLDFL